MATKKKVIQGGLDVQTSTGTSALTVDETTGAATLGALNSTAKHAVNGALSGRFAAGIYNIGGASSLETITLSAVTGATDAITLTVAAGNVGYLLCVHAMSAGNSALLYVTYASSTIVEIADVGAIVPGTFTVTKSANSYIVKIENQTAGAILAAVNVIGAVIESATIGT